jgi:hypothetical protein
MNSLVTDQLKVRAEHQQRLAYVYVRQSSMRQVRNHVESQQLQYGFAEQAAHLGWSYERIIVIDGDQGQSGALPLAPGSLGAMVAAVARGKTRPHRTAEEIVELVRKLARDFDDAQIARILHRQGHRSGLGRAFTKSSVASLRHKNNIPACNKKESPDERNGPFTADEAARELGVSMHNTVSLAAGRRAGWRAGHTVHPLANPAS